MLEGMTAGHFIFIPAVLLFGLVIGWILGSRAARDAYAAELRRRGGASRQKDGASNPVRFVILIAVPHALVHRPSPRRWAKLSGSPAAVIFCCARSTPVRYPAQHDLVPVRVKHRVSGSGIAVPGLSHRPRVDEVLAVVADGNRCHPSGSGTGISVSRASRHSSKAIGRCVWPKKQSGR